MLSILKIRKENDGYRAKPQNIRSMMKHSNIYIMEVPEGEKRKKGDENKLKN